MAGKIVHHIYKGDKFNNLTAVVFSHRAEIGGHRYWVFDCDCGTRICRIASRVATGKIKHCGCKKHNPLYVDGRTNHPLHKIWLGMRARCNNPNVKSYKDYGAKGIKICDRWSDFAAFAEDMGERPYGYTIERLDIDLGYSPENCVWASMKAQARNKSNNRLLTHKGKTKCIGEWAEELGLKPGTISMRLNAYGYTVEQALRPVRRD